MALWCACQTPNIDACSAIARQYSGHGIGCRGCCNNIVDDREVLAFDVGTRQKGKGVVQILASRGSTQPLLGVSGARVLDGMVHWNIECVAKIIREYYRLIEAALQASPPVHWYWYKCVGECSQLIAAVV